MQITALSLRIVTRNSVSTKCFTRSSVGDFDSCVTHVTSRSQIKFKKYCNWGAKRITQIVQEISHGP